MISMGAISALLDSADRELVENLFKRYEGLLYNISYDRLHNRTDAEDAVQSTIIKAIDNIEKIRGIDGSETEFYLIAILKNTIIDMQRKAKHLPETNRLEELEGAEDECRVEEIAIHKIEADKVKSALLSLDDKEYEILFLNLVKGYSPAEIADFYGISANTARQRIFRAKQNLKKILEKEGITNDI